MNTLSLSMPGGWEWLIIALIGLLLFGRRLPEVGRSLGKGIIEFKKGLKGIEDDMNEGDKPARSSSSNSPPALREGERWQGQSTPAPSEQAH